MKMTVMKSKIYSINTRLVLNIYGIFKMSCLLGAKVYFCIKNSNPTNALIIYAGSEFMPLGNLCL